MWKPLKVIHLGLDAIKLRNGEIDRIIGRSSQQIIPEIKSGHVKTNGKLIDRLLIGELLLPDEIADNLDGFSGSLILIDDRNNTSIPVWIGDRVSLMVNEPERVILRAIRGLRININEEE